MAKTLTSKSPTKLHSPEHDDIPLTHTTGLCLETLRQSQERYVPCVALTYSKFLSEGHLLCWQFRNLQQQKTHSLAEVMLDGPLHCENYKFAIEGCLGAASAGPTALWAPCEL